jgi:hypothetical protein
VAKSLHDWTIKLFIRERERMKEREKDIERQRETERERKREKQCGAQWAERKILKERERER